MQYRSNRTVHAKHNLACDIWQNRENSSLQVRNMNLEQTKQNQPKQNLECDIWQNSEVENKNTHQECENGSFQVRNLSFKWEIWTVPVNQSNNKFQEEQQCVLSDGGRRGGRGGGGGGDFVGGQCGGGFWGLEISSTFISGGIHMNKNSYRQTDRPTNGHTLLGLLDAWTHLKMWKLVT